MNTTEPAPDLREFLSGNILSHFTSRQDDTSTLLNSWKMILFIIVEVKIQVLSWTFNPSLLNPESSDTTLYQLEDTGQVTKPHNRVLSNNLGLAATSMNLKF